MFDTHSEVDFNDREASARFGGRLVNPGSVGADVTFTITFDADGSPNIAQQGLGDNDLGGLLMFAGLRDDPFIRGPRQGRNIGAVVLEFPTAWVAHPVHGVAIAWAASQVPDIAGPIADLGARALRSMFPAPFGSPTNGMINPADHYNVLGQVPDVVILDVSRPSGFPNGRVLQDDVVDQVCALRTAFGPSEFCILGNDAPFPSTNDKALLAEFPYLAVPHPSGVDGGETIHGSQDDDYTPDP
jgi:hypothetical protein